MYRNLADNMSSKIISLYGMGLSLRDISSHIEEMYVSESEGANFWLSVLTDLKARGLKDILIDCIDNLTGFA